MELTAGKLIRRGPGTLNQAQFKWLLDRSEKVDEILKEIDARRDVYLEAEAAAQARIREAEKAEAGLIEQEQSVAKARDDLAAKTEEAERKHLADMAALNRRLEEIDAQAAEMDKREAELTAREAKLKEGNSKFTDLADWMETNDLKGH